MADLIEHCLLLKDTVIVPIRWQESRGLGQVSSEGGICFESASNVVS